MSGTKGQETGMSQGRDTGSMAAQAKARELVTEHRLNAGEGFFESDPILMEAIAQALEDAVRPYREALTLSEKCVAEIRRCTDECEHYGDNDACKWCELIAEYDEAKEALTGPGRRG